LYEKTETDEFFEELEKFISTDEYGDSDTDSSGHSGDDERRAKKSYNVGIAHDKYDQVGENEYREKSPGFGDFFRINDDHIQFTGGHGRTDLLSIDNNRSNDGYTIPETFDRNVIIKKKIKK